jgi:hypothetical protein
MNQKNSSQIIRILAIRYLVWPRRKDFSYPYFFITGINPDGSCYFKNRYTELPNEFALAPADFEKRIFEKTKNALEKAIVSCNDGNSPSETWCFNVDYDDASSKDFQFVNKDLHFYHSDYNDMLAQHNFFGVESDYVARYKGKLNLDDVRYDVRSGEIPFSRFYNKRVEYMITGLDDYMDAKYVIRPDGSIDILESVGCVHYETCISINRNGFIEKSGGYPYVEILMKNHVRIINDVG